MFIFVVLSLYYIKNVAKNEYAIDEFIYSIKKFWEVKKNTYTHTKI